MLHLSRLVVSTLLLTLFAAADARGQHGVSITTRVERMLARAQSVHLDQTWEWLEEELSRGVLALQVCDVDVEAELFQAACKKMFRAKLQKCESIAWRLVAVQGLPEDWPGRKKRTGMDLKLLLKCRKGGAFVATPDTKPRDWSVQATHAAALGLRAAMAMGHKVSKKTWRGIAEHLLDSIQDSPNKLFQGDERFVFTNVADAITTLTICRHNLPPSAEIPKAIDELWRYLDEHSLLIGEADHFATEVHLSLMRAAIASNRIEVGGESWFEQGVNMLARVEIDGGGWIPGKSDTPDGWRGYHPHNIEATLFLARAFQAILVPPGDPASLTTISATSSLLDQARTLEAVVHRGLDAQEEILSALRSSIELRRSLAIQAVYRLSGSAFGFQPAMLPGSPEAKAAITEIRAWWP